MKWIEYYDEKANLIFELPSYEITYHEKLQNFFDYNKELLIEFIFNSIEFAILNNLEVVPCFIINDDYVITIDKSSFQEKLDICLDFFIKTEQYEKCSLIVKLKEILKNKSSGKV